MIDYIGKSNQLKGMVFCFTGKAPKPRTEMTAMAIAAGGSVTKSVTLSTTTLVIVDPNSKSTKARKARSMGLDLITPEEFFELCGNPVPIDEDENDGWWWNYDLDKWQRTPYQKPPPKPKTKNDAVPKVPDKNNRYTNKRRIQL